jgi:hypothetical protein
MKFSKQEKDILSNVYNINRGLIIDPSKSKKGKTSVISIHPQHHIVATYTLPYDFKNLITIGDMGKFMGILSSFKNPEVTFYDDYLTVSEDSSNVKLVYSTMSQIYHPEDQMTKRLKSGNLFVEFKISSDELNRFIKSSHVLSLKHIRVIGDGKTVKLSAENVGNPSSDTCEFKIDDGQVSQHGVVDVFFDKTMFNFVDGQYTIQVCSVKNADDIHLLIASNADIDIQYMVVEDSEE